MITMKKSINPYNNKVLFEFEELDDDQLQLKLELAQKAYISWKQVSMANRSVLMFKVAEGLKGKSEKYGKIISQEMGKPISQAIAEVEKCAWLCEDKAKQAE